MKPNYWREFSKREDVEETVRGIVNAQPFNVAFESTVISQLILDRHYFCSLRGLRPARFKKTHEDRPYRFYGFFEEHGWHSVSWNKCVKPPLSKKATIIAALRNRIEAEKISFRRKHPICAHCGTASAEETHHADPTFVEITDRLFAGVTSRDIDNALTGWNWFEKAQFTIPEGHIIQRLFDEIHSTARLEALCKQCHNVTKRAQRTAVAIDVTVEQPS